MKVQPRKSRRDPTKQLDLFERGRRGGRRSGAGRPPGRRTTIAHRRRPAHQKAHPAHVTLRIRPELPSLRQPRFAVLRRRFARASREWFRIVHFSVQANHIHLLVEADDADMLARGMQGLAIRLARAVNRVLGRRGTVFAERYHARALSSPREARNSIVYVLQNWKHHQTNARGVDPCSSGPWFMDWKEQPPPWRAPPPVRAARTWLLAQGWKLGRGLISLGEVPLGSPRPRAL